MRTAIIINDCRDDNAAARQVARVSSLLECQTTFIGVGNDLEAAGNIIDAIDALGGRDGVVLCNVAPRSGEGQKWPNGSPFGFFDYERVTVVTTIDGLTLSLVKKFYLAKEIQVCDFSQAVKLIDEITFSSDSSAFNWLRARETQFRSYEFAPYLARLLTRTDFPPNLPEGTNVLPIDKISDTTPAVWWVDNFGNCKTTLLIDDLLKMCDTKKQSLLTGQNIQTNLGSLPFFPRLQDVPDKHHALVVGSSGLGSKRFIEIVIRGDSAAKQFGLSSLSPFQLV